MKTTLIWAAILGATGVALGALGAHALKGVLEPQQLASFETGVRYQLIHAVVLLFLALAENRHRFLQVARNLIIIGVLCFSFSIYGLSLQTIFGVGLRFLGPITPLGGLFLIAGWLMILAFALKLPVKREI